MADDYDQLDDGWYPHLYRVLTEVVLAQAEALGAGRALDVGCGTGMLSLLLADAGFEVHGFDLSAGLLRVAQRKVRTVQDTGQVPWPLFTCGLPGADTRQQAWRRRARQLRGDRPVLPPALALGDAHDPTPYAQGPYDLVVCVGSTLSLVEEPRAVLQHCATALRSGGLLVLEVEQRLAGDTLWGLVDGVLGGRLGVVAGRRDALALLSAPGRSLRLGFPFPLGDGSTVTLPLWLFSVPELQGWFAQLGLQVRARRGVHVLTNLLPSGLLHRVGSTGLVGRVVAGLAELELGVAARSPWSRLGCSVIYVLRRP